MGLISITGASGFVGCHLIKTLINHSDVNIRVLKRRNPVCQTKSMMRMVTVEGNLLKRKTLSALLEADCTVINLAYLAKKPLKENLIAACNLAKTCVEKRIRRLVHCSSAVICGATRHNKVTEETTCKPHNEYEIAKWEIEKRLIEIARDKFELVIVRPTAVYGPGGKNLLKMADELIKGNVFIRYLRSCLYNQRKMNLVSIDNVTHAIAYLALAEQRLDKQVFIISDDDEPMNNYREVEKCLISNLGVNDYYLPIIPLPKCTFMDFEVVWKK